MTQDNTKKESAPLAAPVAKTQPKEPNEPSFTEKAINGASEVFKGGDSGNNDVKRAAVFIEIMLAIMASLTSMGMGNIASDVLKSAVSQIKSAFSTETKKEPENSSMGANNGTPTGESALAIPADSTTRTSHTESLIAANQEPVAASVAAAHEPASPAAPTPSHQ